MKSFFTRATVLAPLCFVLATIPQTLRGAEKVAPPAGKVVAKPAEAEGKIENDPYFTGFLDSAAHFYQVERGLVAFALARSQLRLNTDTKTADIRNEITRSGFEALAVYAPVPMFRGGIGFYRLSDTYNSGVTSDDLVFDTKRKEQESNYTPFAEIDLLQSISLGMEYSLTTRTVYPEDREVRSISSSRVSQSIVYHRPKFEIGLTYRPTVQLEENGLSQIETGSTTITSQYLVCDGTSLGLAFQEIRISELDRDAYRNSYEPKLLAEAKIGGPLKVGGSFAYRTSSSKEDAFASPLTIPRVVSMAFVSYGVTPQARVGFTYYNYYAQKKVENSTQKTLGHSGELGGTFRF